jgi:hypothetical protein
MPEVEAPGFRGDPDLARRAVPVDDHFRAVLELDLEQARSLGLHVGIRRARLERALQRGQRRTRQVLEFALCHAGLCSTMVILAAVSTS